MFTRSHNTPQTRVDWLIGASYIGFYNGLDSRGRSSQDLSTSIVPGCAIFNVHKRQPTCSIRHNLKTPVNNSAADRVLNPYARRRIQITTTLLKHRALNGGSTAPALRGQRQGGESSLHF